MRAIEGFAFLMLAILPAAQASEPVSSDPTASGVETTASLGVPLAAIVLDSQRGGDDDITHNIIEITGDVSDNTANNVATGANSINEGSFANSSGITTVVQNTGANVLVQSATIVNVQFVDP